jgi:CDP-diacylglycerol--serine O-phosphatidyltransferase
MLARYFDGANAVTGLNLLIGVVAIQCALSAHMGLSLVLVFVAVLLDHLDGFLARRFYAAQLERRDFGKQFDTLADLLNFNIVPAIQLMLLRPRPVTLLIGALLVLFGAVRLAHFNLSSDGGRDYQGLPTTYVGFALINLMMLARANDLDSTWLLGFSALLAVLQISAVPIRIPRTTVCVGALSLVFLINLAVCGIAP